MMQLSTLKNGRATTDLAYVLPESHKQMYGTIKYVLVFYESNCTTFLHVSKRPSLEKYASIFGHPIAYEIETLSEACRNQLERQYSSLMY